MIHSDEPQPGQPPSPTVPDGGVAVSWRAAVAGTVVAAPAAADQVVVVASVVAGSAGGGGAVQAFEAATGARRWTFDGDAGLTGAVAATPAIAGGLVVFGTSAGTVHALHLADGTAAWHADLGRGRLARVTIHDQLVLAAGEDQRLHALDLRSGAARWQVAAGGAVYTGPAVRGDEIYVANDAGVLIAAGAAGVRWQVGLPATMPVAVTAAGDRVLVSMLSDGSLRAVDPDRHAPVWSLPGTPPATGSPVAPLPVVVDGVVCVADGDRLLGLDPASGAQRWAVEAPADPVAPAASGGLAITAGRDGRVVAVDAARGRVAWTWSHDTSITSGLAAGAGALYFVDVAGRLVAVTH